MHLNKELSCPACISALGGKRETKVKAEAARENGKLGGRSTKGVHR